MLGGWSTGELVTPIFICVQTPSALVVYKSFSIAVEMAHSLSSRSGYGSASALSSLNKRAFAESNPHTLVGLQKVKVQLEKEISKLEREQATAVTNISNNQQAMKMSWRRLQQRRRMESPPPSRSRETENSKEVGPKLGIFHSKTRLYVSTTPEVYHPEARNDDQNTHAADSAPPTSAGLQGELYNIIVLAVLPYSTNHNYVETFRH